MYTSIRKFQTGYESLFQALSIDVTMSLIENADKDKFSPIIHELKFKMVLKIKRIKALSNRKRLEEVKIWEQSINNHGPLYKKELSGNLG